MLLLSVISASYSFTLSHLNCLLQARVSEKGQVWLQAAWSAQHCTALCLQVCAALPGAELTAR